MSEFHKILAELNQRSKHHLAAHDPHPEDQGLHFEQILPLQLSFCAICNKNAGNAQHNVRRVLFYILEKPFFLQVIVADSVTGRIIIGRKR